VYHTKLFLIYYASELDTNSVQLCKIANAFIPRQFEGSSCVCKNSAHPFCTSSNCKRLAARNKTLSNQEQNI